VQTPTHTLLAFAALSKSGDNKRNWVIFAGSLIPDALIYVCWVWLTFVKQEPQSRIWNEIYFDTPMQLTGAIFNSVPIYLFLAVVAIILMRGTWGKLLLVFALAALIHIATDLPVHADDAHRHFWPLTDWRFYSPFSYWDGDHHAGIVSLVELALALGAIIVLWRRFRTKWPRIILGLCALYMIGTLVAFYIVPALQGG